ncbi:hypothetical protein Hdeb2414_s0002g00054581 [Helianthus debilis subsp. tardiflorus]
MVLLDSVQVTGADVGDGDCGGSLFCCLFCSISGSAGSGSDSDYVLNSVPFGSDFDVQLLSRVVSARVAQRGLVYIWVRCGLYLGGIKLNPVRLGIITLMLITLSHIFCKRLKSRNRTLLDL